MPPVSSSMCPGPRRQSDPGARAQVSAAIIRSAIRCSATNTHMEWVSPSWRGNTIYPRRQLKKIVYNRKAKENLPFYPHAVSAEQYSQAGLLEEWIHTYLLFERRNREFSEGLRRQPRQYTGPVAMPLSLFTRSSGPEEHMKWRVHPIVWEENVAVRQRCIRRQELLPPLIVNYGEGGFELNCGSPLYEALIREGIPYFPVIVWCSSETEQEEFAKKYVPSMVISV